MSRALLDVSVPDRKRRGRRKKDLARTDAAPAAGAAPNAGADPAPPNGCVCDERREETRRVEWKPQRWKGEVRARSSWFEKKEKAGFRRGATGRDAPGR